MHRRPTVTRLSALLACAAALGVPSLSCGNNENVCERQSPPDLVVFVAAPIVAGTVESSSGCTTVQCDYPVDGGCAEWRGRMTTADSTRVCTVTYRGPDGGVQVRKVTPRLACDQPAPGEVKFGY